MPSKKIEGYSIGIKKLCGDRYILLGNATEFLDPVFSSGHIKPRKLWEGF